MLMNFNYIHIIHELAIPDSISNQDFKSSLGGGDEAFIASLAERSDCDRTT